MITLASIPDRLKELSADHAARQRSYEAARRAFEDAKAEAANIAAKRAELDEAKRAAESETAGHAAKWRDRIRSAAAEFLAGKAKESTEGLGEAMQATKVAAARADELAAMGSELEAMQQAARERIASTGQTMLATHNLAAKAFARVEALKALQAIAPAVARARAVSFATDTTTEETAWFRYVDLPAACDAIDDDEATGGLGRAYALKSEIEQAMAAA